MSEDTLGGDFEDIKNFILYSKFIPKCIQNLVFGKEKAPAIQRSKIAQYGHMGKFSIVESRGFLKAKNPNFERTSV